MGNHLSKCSCRKQSTKPQCPPPAVPPKPLTHDEIIKASALSDWQVVRRLGKGAFGVVELVIHRAHPEVVAAMKIVSIYEPDPKKPPRKPYDPNKEWKEMQQLSHPHIVRCFRAWRVENHSRPNSAAPLHFLHILLEYVEGRDLGNFLGNATQVDDETAGRVFVQLLWALWYMAQRKMWHRDLKPENILLTTRGTDGDVKITDFGFARTMPEADGVSTDLSTCGTPPYMAPERLRKQDYSFPADIWSLGLILVELITKEHLFARYQRSLDELREAQLYVADWLRQSLPADYESLTDLILGMLAFEAKDRWSPVQIAEHPWVKFHMTRNKVQLVMPSGESSLLVSANQNNDLVES